ncbi:P-loop containing nucleoside triphosphate hydrolase protein [Dacryopinax primogenitus]|uniref:RNA helicase n=1 Tax=Dacryopinax primogenitus (strain DJM 731) TaxID=1858805 RepID=M5GG82_DACPD|nr:P-loop containing nucleoside triphosphate hydrolase protein [Dacryopinax primogenitus]EJU05033.1 P-loop containing nucleoside triphosphate hydrolase protein [Dacryopinax primogenitus]
MSFKKDEDGFVTGPAANQGSAFAFRPANAAPTQSSLASRVGQFSQPQAQGLGASSPTATSPTAGSGAQGLSVFGAAARGSGAPAPMFGGAGVPQQGVPKAGGAQRPPQQGLEGRNQPVPGRGDAEDRNNLVSTLQDYEVQVTLADQQADPNSPLYSIKRFQDLGLAPELLQGLTMMNFFKPSKVQERALPLLLQNPPRNLIGQSQSGTGKTAAFTLTMLSRVDFAVDATQAICMAPTRELARQILDVVVTMGKFTPVTTFCAVPEMGADGKMHAPSAPTKAQIVVGTPGTVANMVKYKKIDVSQVQVFVLDEADNMLDAGALNDQCLEVKNRLPKENGKTKAQIVLFSATFPDEVRMYADKIAPEANKIELKKEELSVANIAQFYMDCKDAESRNDILAELYGILTVGQSIVFCDTRAVADSIADRMRDDYHKVAALHGAKDAAARDALIDSFRDGKTKVLITTNVMARGIDIPQVNMIVNYDMPKDASGRPDAETYLHRIGRTGRFGAKGVAINFVHDLKSWNEMRQIERVLNRPIIRVETDDIDLMEKTFNDVLKKKVEVQSTGVNREVSSHAK